MYHNSSYRPPIYKCTFTGCRKSCKNKSGLTRHQQLCIYNLLNTRVYGVSSESSDSETASNDQGERPQTPLRSSPAIGNPEPPTPSHISPTRSPASRTGIYVQKHPFLDGQPCDSEGWDLPRGSPPSDEPNNPEPFFPFENEADFQLANFIFTRDQMSQGNTNVLMNIWSAWLKQHGVDDLDPPFSSSKHLLDQIDSIPLGDIPWEGFKVSYNGELPETDVPKWMKDSYEVWFRNPLDVMEQQLANPDYAHEVDYSPKQVYGQNGKRQYTDLMSGKWAWQQADIIAQDIPESHGAVFAPVILGSDKTTVSVASGQNDYYPLYASLGNIQNHVRRAHRGALSVIGFLAIPKPEKHEQDSVQFRNFRRQLFHASLTKILSPLRPWMTRPRVTKCGDGHYRRIIYGIGPYIADYPEQCLLACVVSGWCPRCTALRNNLDGSANTSILRSHEHLTAVHAAFGGNLKQIWDGYGYAATATPFTANFPRANIHNLLSPDILHQLVKGTFKDHLVDWVVSYMESQPNGKRRVAEMDRRIAISPFFAGLRRFKEGRGFSQWTGKDSRSLMRVFLPAIRGLVPDQMVRAVAYFLDFCYLVRRSQIDEDDIERLKKAISCFHEARQIFCDLGIREDFNLPRQHSILHYPEMIEMFGAPNGLCSSLTESYHIRAVKQPWRRSNRNEPLGQMLLINQRIEKIAAMRRYLLSKGWLTSYAQAHPPVRGTHTRPFIPPPIQDEAIQVPTIQDHEEDEDAGVGDDDVEGLGELIEGLTSEGDVRFPTRPAQHAPSTLLGLALYAQEPRLIDHVRKFLYDQLNPDSEIFGMDVDLSACPPLLELTRVRVFHSAIAIYHAPSDLSGMGGMHHEHIRATPWWAKSKSPRYDCVFVDRDKKQPGFAGLGVAHVRAFFSFQYGNTTYPCALIKWFETYGDEPDPVTGMWRIQPDYDARHRRLTSVVHLDSITRAAHLLPACGPTFIPSDMSFLHTLTSFKVYYVNKYIDYHANEIAF